MDAAYASLQARLDTFAGPAAPKTKSRRTSTRSKKAAPKAASKAAWPLTSPTPVDLATAGFVWRATPASPDNVQCFSCECQLDGWEAEDTPILEHLTHSPNCGFAINMCIRLRSDDPERVEEDPMSERMINARRATFANLWPLDPAAGFPTMDQMVTAGWCYDPTTDTPDGVTCPYCLLSLDAWDAGDDPMEEHRRRAADCLFFSLQELYNPIPKPKATKGKRVSSRSSTASQKATKKATRGKRASTKSNLDKPLPSPPDETFAEVVDAPTEITNEPPTEISVSEPTKAPTKGRKTKKAAKSRASTVSTASITRSTRGKKRTSEEMEETDVIEIPKPAPKRASKRTKVSNVSSVMPESVFESTPVHTPHVASPVPEPEPMIIPEPVPEPKTKPNARATRAPPPKPRAMTPEPPQLRTPEAKSTVKVPLKSQWDPVNIEEFFENKHEMFGLVSTVLVDSSLDQENMEASMGDSPGALVEAVKAGLTSPEKKMTLEQWVMYNAKRGEEKLRMECERQIAAFDVQARRALATLDAIPAL